MRRFLIYLATAIGTIIAIFVVGVVAVVVIAKDEAQRTRYSYMVGTAIGYLIVAGILVLIGFGLYKLFKLAFPVDADRQVAKSEKPADDVPLDRYLK